MTTNNDNIQWQQAMTRDNDKRQWQQALTTDNDNEKWHQTMTTGNDYGQWQQRMTADNDSRQWQRTMTMDNDNGQWLWTMTADNDNQHWQPTFDHFNHDRSSMSTVIDSNPTFLISPARDLPNILGDEHKQGPNSLYNTRMLEIFQELHKLLPGCLLFLIIVKTNRNAHFINGWFIHVFDSEFAFKDVIIFILQMSLE